MIDFKSELSKDIKQKEREGEITIDFELELNKAIKQKEKEREVLFQEITRLKMQVATYRESMQELSKLGVTLPTEQIINTLNKLENITIDTLDTITDEDIKILQTTYTFTTEKVTETEKLIMDELKLTPKETATDILFPIGIVEEQDSGAGLFSEYLL